MKMNRLTPVLMVDQIEPCLPFWVDRLGFSKTVELPEGDALGFVILVRDGVEVMYQSRASVKKDIAELAGNPVGASMLYIDVEDVDAVEKALAGVPQIMPRRTTFYGADEVLVRDPAGNTIVFAQYAKTAAS